VAEIDYKMFLQLLLLN